jgi:hypothetical protein
VKAGIFTYDIHPDADLPGEHASRVARGGRHTKMTADRAEQPNPGSLPDEEIRRRMLAEPGVLARIEEIRARIKGGDSSDRAMTEEELQSFLRDEP